MVGVICAGLTLLVAEPAAATAGADLVLRNGALTLVIDRERGTIVDLGKSDDPDAPNFLAPQPEGRAAAALGDVSLRYRPANSEWTGVGSWRSATSLASGAGRQVTASPDGQTVTVTYTGGTTQAKAFQDVDVTETYVLTSDGVSWRLTVRNRLAEPLQLGDIALPLPFNTNFKREKDAAVTYTKYVIRHALISGDNSHLYWMRPDGEGPALVMTPDRQTHLEYYDDHGEDDRGDFAVYIHALAQARYVEPRGTWNQPVSDKILAATGQPGDTVTYGFTFHIAGDYQAIRDRFVTEGLLDIDTVPGMVIPTDLSGEVSIRSANGIEKIDAEYPEETTIETLKSPVDGRQLYRIRFTHLGENNITVKWDGGRETQLEYFVTEPLRTLVQKRAAFIVDHQQVRDPSKWYDGLFSVWDMEEKVLRTPDDTGGLDGFIVGGSDDPDLAKAPYVATKNLAYPDDRQIAALEYYAQHFVWGKLQRTDQETPNPYGIYGVRDWKTQRESVEDQGGYGRQKMWRAYDYPHLIQFYLTMYQIGCLYPDKLHYLTADGYLDRAVGTAKAYFLVPYSIVMDEKTGFPGYNDWAYKLGTMHEYHLVDLMDALDKVGRQKDAAWIRKEWEKKVKFFVYDDLHPFGSEMWFDTTAFESTHAIARYGLTHPQKPDHYLWRDKNTGEWYSHASVRPEDFSNFMGRSIAANIAARGWTETNYYQLGSDYRGSRLRGFLTYMSQMGGAPVLDYGLNFAPATAEGPDRFAYIRLGYASGLSAWALMNTGTVQSDYGYWYPGAMNDGASGWEYLASKYGYSVFGSNIQQGRGAWRYDGEVDNGYSEALNAARTVVVRDPIFGLTALGGTVDAVDNAYRISTRDGLQQRVSVRDGQLSVDLQLARDGFRALTPIVLDRDGKRLSFTLENRDGGAHLSTLTVKGWPAGTYVLTAGGQSETVKIKVGAIALDLKVKAGAETSVLLEAK
jgi:hypothetical protein